MAREDVHGAFSSYVIVAPRLIYFCVTLLRSQARSTLAPSSAPLQQGFPGTVPTVYKKTRLPKTLVTTLRPHRQPERFLSVCHALLRPKTYIEIGVNEGRSLALALDTTHAVGVDPDPHVRYPLGRRASITEDESDKFFESNVATELFHGSPVDLSFIDGLHLFEQALRDFRHTERLCHRNSIVILDDCVPLTEEHAQRERCGTLWTGDVWKLLFALAEYRSDLQITLLDLYPAGLAIIENLDPTSTIIESNESRLLSEFMSRPFPGKEFLTERFNTLAFGPQVISNVLAPHSRSLTAADCLTLERRYYRLRWGEWSVAVREWTRGVGRGARLKGRGGWVVP